MTSTRRNKLASAILQQAAANAPRVRFSLRLFASRQSPASRATASITPDTRERAMRAAQSFLFVLLLGGCSNLGPQSLNRDHLEYGQAIAETAKQQLLLNIARIRYGDVPTFVSVDQLVSSYQLQSTSSASVIPNPVLGYAFPSATGGITFTDRPTMTFSPVTGAVLAGSFVRPLAPREVLLPAQNGLGIDVLLHLAVQSIGSLSNAGRLENRPASLSTAEVGSPEFFELLKDLRVLQEGGALSFRFTGDKDGSRVFLTILNGRDGALTAVAARVRTLLGVGPGEVEVVYGRIAHGPNQVAMLTRSFIGIMTSVGAQIDVPRADIEANRALASLGNPGIRERPAVIVHTSQGRPQFPYVPVAVQYRDRWFWIDDADFASKDAFRTMLMLMQLSESGADRSKAPVLTIPAAP